MLRRTLAGFVTALALAIAALYTTPVEADTRSAAAAGISVPVSGNGTGATFTGELTLQRFVRAGDKVYALGTFTGTVTNTVTNVTRNVVRQVRIPVNLTQTTATCEILTLTLGPLDLDLLGLQVHLDRVVLNIQAEPGPGNLLGNLLCSLARLLDGQGGVPQIVSLLNRILGALS